VRKFAKYVGMENIVTNLDFMIAYFVDVENTTNYWNKQQFPLA
jgi:hypothetical protein